MKVPLTPLEFRQRAASLYGDKVGIVDGIKRFTYQDYDLRINRFANALTELGVESGEVISFITYNSHQLLEAYYAVPQIEGILNPVNIRLSHQEIEDILNHAGTKVLCFHHDFSSLVDRIRENLPLVEKFISLEGEPRQDWSEDYETLLLNASPEADVDLDSINEDAVIELFYTSGTTGTPRAVQITNRTLYMHTLTAINGFRVSDHDTLLHVVPLFHVNGWGSPQFLTAVGGKHVMLRKVDFAEMLRLIEVERVTKLLGVPTIFNGLLQHPDLKEHDLSSLEEVIIGGAPSPLSLIKALEKEIGCRAYVGYGLTETSPFITIARPKPHLEIDDELRQVTQVKTGLPLVGVRIRVVNEQGKDVPRDEKSIGEIVVRGNQVMKGYLNDPEGTRTAIVDGWLHTGDMAVVDEEGYITIVDRKKDIIISGGENIASVEIEKVLQDHPAVFEVVVIGVPDDQWGEVPWALVVLNPDQAATEQELIQYVKERLARYKAPKSVEFMDEFPRGGTGKILKQELKKRFWTGKGKKVQ